MMSITITVNDESRTVEVEGDMPLLWVLRDTLGLTGTKYSCGRGLCGSCTVHVDGEAVQSCTVPVESIQGKRITTIEGLTGTHLHPVQQAWIDENVSQCGYCQPGQIMSAVALLNNNKSPSPADMDAAMAGNLCRCGTYQRIRKAIERAAQASLTGMADDGAPLRSAEYGKEASLIGSLADTRLEGTLPVLLPLAGAMVFTAAGKGSKISRRGFLQVAAASGASLVIGLSLPGCRNRPDEASPETATQTGSQEAVGTATPPPAEAGSTLIPPLTQETGVVGARPSLTGEATFVPQTQATGQAEQAPTTVPTSTPEPSAFFEPNVYLSVDNNGLVTIFVHRVELGQGARTALPMIVAEELEVDWADIRVIQAPGDSIYGKQQTSGSSCITETFAPLRLAGAQAREMLIAAAAQRWGVESGSCQALKGTVVHESSGRVLPYGELVEEAAEIPPTRGRMKDRADFKIIGKPFGHVDNAHIVTGEVLFGADVPVEGVLYAAVARSPELRNSIESFDASEVERLPGVRHIVPIESGVAIVADDSWTALKGKGLLDITWQPGRLSTLSSEEVSQAYREVLSGVTVEANVLESFYEVSFLAHGTPSPMNCTADVRSDGCTVWAPTQAPQQARSVASRFSGHGTAEVLLHVTRVGGGFGRRLQVDYVREAVEISREIGRPVKLLWSREDDIQHDYYHPLSVHRATADLADPRMPRIQSETYGDPDRITGAWRAVANFTDGFVRECFIDEMAYALDRDPLELRLEILPGAFEPLIEAARERSGWGDPLPEGRGRGIAAYSTWGVTPVVMVAEVSLEGRQLRVHRVVTVIDCGTVINPNLVEAQMEGGIAWGLSALLGNEITIENGQVRQSNFHDYPILRFDQMPLVESIIMPSGLTPMGVGEMGVPPISPAVLNALFSLTGNRIRNLPIKQGDL